jgi:hypothetical protein
MIITLQDNDSWSPLCNGNRWSWYNHCWYDLDGGAKRRTMQQTMMTIWLDGRRRLSNGTLAVADNGDVFIYGTLKSRCQSGLWRFLHGTASNTRLQCLQWPWLVHLGLTDNMISIIWLGIQLSKLIAEFNLRGMIGDKLSCLSFGSSHLKELPWKSKSNKLSCFPW